MRVLLSTALLVVLGLLAVAPSRTTAQGQYVQAGIASGEKLILSFQPNEAGRSCTVIEVRGDFVGCRADAPQIGGGSTAAPGPSMTVAGELMDAPAKAAAAAGRCNGAHGDRGGNARWRYRPFTSCCAECCEFAM